MRCKKTQIVLLFGIIPDKQYNEIIKNSIGAIQYAADALQKSLIVGLSYFTDFNIINLPFIGSWPSRYKSWLSSNSYKYSATLENGSFVFSNFRFINITGIKMLARYIIAKWQIKKYCEKNKTSEIVLLIYSIHTPFLKAAIDAKWKYDNLKIIQIVPDLPEYMGGNTKGLLSFIRVYNHQLLNKLYKHIDGFILLSEHMKHRLIRRGQPYVVIEGIYNPTDETCTTNTKDGKKVILYSGTLARRYNVMDLVYAVRSLKRNDFVLEIYGDGDSREEIEAISKKDIRIFYGGQILRNEIIKRQRQAYILVNPRKSEGEYTKYSFPSKTMEYLASGTPTLMYRLPGVPIEYYSYFFTPDKENIESLAKKINEILDMQIKTLIDFGERARRFILEKKNPKAQCERMMDLIEKL